MYVWVLKVFDRDDENCQYDSKVVAIYSEENFNKAIEHFEKLCSFRIEDSRESDEIDKWKTKNGYFFYVERNNGYCYKYSSIELEKKEVM